LRSSLERLLELLGYEVATARDGAAALAMHQAHATMRKPFSLETLVAALR